MQSRMHLQALTHSFPRLKEIRICGRRQEKARHLTDEYGNRFKGRALAVRDAETAVRGADIVVTATTTDKPIIEKDWLKDGVFYAQIGSHECTFEAAAAFDRIYVDDWQQLLRRGVQTLAIMANQGLWSEERLTGTLGERLLGKVPGRESKREKIMFSSIGLGVTDIVMASRIYRTAVAKRIGNKVPL
jgi:ornithine cyclodeaminase